MRNLVVKFYVIFFFLVIFFCYDSYSQSGSYECEIFATVDDTLICSGEQVNLSAIGTITLTLLANDFNTGLVGTGWSATTTATFTNPCGAGPDGSICLWMGDQSPAPRQLESIDFDVHLGGDIFFYMKYAVQGDVSPCEGPDEIDEGITLQYSINQGSSWVPISYFNPSGVVEMNGNIYQGQSTSAATGPTPFTSWAQYTFPIPAAAQTTATRFRWIQEVSTDNVYDHWGLDSIFIRANAPDVEITWAADPGTNGFPFTGANPPSVSPTQTTLFTATINNGTISCNDVVQVVVGNILSEFTVNDSAQCLEGNSFIFTSQGNLGSGTTYLWDFGDGQTSNLVNPVHAFSNPGSFTVVLNVSNGACSSNVNHVMVVNDNPTINFTCVPSCESFCNGSINIVSSGTVAPYSYLWESGSTSQAISNLCSGVQNVTTTDANGCASTENITVGANPQINLSVFIDSVNCFGQNNGSATIIASGGDGTGFFSYQWDTNAGSQITSTAENLYSGTYSVTIADNLGCTVDTFISVHQPTALSLTAVSDTSICPNTIFSLGAFPVGGTPPYLFYWDDTLNSASLTIIPQDTTTHTIFVTDINNCISNTDSVIISVINIDASFSINDPSQCLNNNTFSFSNLGLFGQGQQYFWDFGDNQFSSLENPVHNYNNSGAFVVKFKVTSETCSDSISDSIFVYAHPLISISNTPTCGNICNGSATVTGTGTAPPYLYEWDSGITSQSVNNLCAGFCSVSITDGNNCQSFDSIEISIFSPIEIQLYSSPVICYGQNNGTATVIASGGDGSGIFYYQWDSAASNQSTSTATNLYFGSYNLTITNEFNCLVDTFVFVQQPTQLSITASSDTHLCYQGQGVLSAYPVGGVEPYEYYWGNYNGSATFTVSPDSDTLYNVFVIDSNQCISNTASINVTTDPKLELMLSVSDTAICPGSQAFINASITGGDGGPYYLFNSQMNNIALPYAVFPDNSNQPFILYAKDHCGATAVDSVFFQIFPIPNIIFSPDVFKGCQPLVVHFNGGSINDVLEYNWNFHDIENSTSGTSNPVHTFSEPGSYDVTLSVISQNGCPNSLTIHDLITVYKNPEARFYCDPEVVCFLTPTVNFFNLSTDYIFSIWDFNDGDSSLMENPYHNYDLPGTFNVKLNVLSQYGCKDSCNQKVIIQNEFTFYAPSAFSPNNDGICDYFQIFSYGLNPQTFFLQIYNRWGEIIFSSNNLKFQWSGNMDNVIVQNGTYTWLAEFYDFNGQKHVKAGAVTVIR